MPVCLRFILFSGDGYRQAQNRPALLWPGNDCLIQIIRPTAPLRREKSSFIIIARSQAEPVPAKAGMPISKCLALKVIGGPCLKTLLNFDRHLLSNYLTCISVYKLPRLLIRCSLEIGFDWV